MSRRIAALRALAERPGTEHEGIVAREMLRRAEANRTPEDALIDKFSSFLRTGSMDDLSQAVGPRRCACGREYPAFRKCENFAGHEAIQSDIRRMFAKGQRVYYNCWAYSKNCPGKVAAFVKPQKENGNFPWAWISVKFDHLKSARQVPAFSAKGWHLTPYAVDEETLRQTGIAG